MAKIQRFFLQDAMLPTGWARDVAVDIEDGWIRAIGTDATGEGRERIAGIVIPGLPNLHSHTFQRGMAGLAETRGPQDDGFWTWRQVMYGFLGQLTPDDVEAVAAFAMMEMLEAGFTALAEFHYVHHDKDGSPYANLAELCARIAAAAGETGIGLTLLPVLYSHGGFGGQAPHEGQRRFLNDVPRYLRLLEGARAAARPLDDAVVGIAPHSLRAVTESELLEILAAVKQGPVHIHIAEQTKEIDDCLAWSQQRPVEWLYNHIPVDARWCLIHATHMTREETQRFARSGAVAGLCPITEANLGDGIFEGVEFLQAQGLFGVGSDSNVEIDAPGELRFFEYSQRLKHRARNVVSQREGQSTGRALYDGALAGGARALGRRIGALAPGHRADFVVLDARHADLAALTGDRWLDAYLFVAGKRLVDSVFVGGQSVVTQGRHRKREAIAARYGKVMQRLVG